MKNDKGRYVEPTIVLNTSGSVLRKRFVRYLGVGLLNTAFGYGAFAAFIYLGFHYTAALLMATILGILFNFKSIGLLVFNTSNNRLLLKFIAGYVALYFLNVMCMKLCTSLSINIYLSSAIILPLSAVIGFLINNRFVFNETN